MKRLVVLVAILSLLLIVLPVIGQTTQPAGVELVGVDGFKGGCDEGINIAGFTVRFNVAGDVTIRGQAYADFYDETTVIRSTAGGGALEQFTINSKPLPENTVVQLTISNGTADHQVHVAVNCTTGQVFLQRLLGFDGRLHAGNDLQVVIYPKLDRNRNVFLDFYTADNNGRGRRTLRVTHATLSALPAAPSSNIKIASTRDGLATLYKLTSGEYQVNYQPTAEGKVPVVIFDALSPTRVQRADY